MSNKVNNALGGIVSASMAKAYLLFPSAPIVKKKKHFTPTPKKRLS